MIGSSLRFRQLLSDLCMSAWHHRQHRYCFARMGGETERNGNGCLTACLLA